ncbi:hypothetical protein [Mycolicibacterium brumae]|uniref:Uncharacterized protein n=1 Tax=Mycolicibacterium brumae TaxID=85968 RepID=A0A2G5PFR4_9MYCO|nr:hypothetical protein [Mycolicibacterium brumae]MCV7192285.1 hypothetical protein [Mycolicibacterium brumae]PIB77158.1 hypothetical protein CQY22_002575 [Mycolicibacterium brumae]RWA21620.1 hypothetical protein MBRU_14185 [Mycolicibacterium brumae DSM 44177]UWW10500.1 hypothetical protein L2Z93_003630 [Mycolicibacterium brumae]
MTTVLVTGPADAGRSSVCAVLAAALPDCDVVEHNVVRPELTVFVASANAPLTLSDRELLDDADLAVLTKIDRHRRWRDVLAQNRAITAASGLRWVAAAAAPDLGEVMVDGLTEAVRSALADPDLARRRRIRAVRARLEGTAAALHGRIAARRGEVAALAAQRDELVRSRAHDRSARAAALRLARIDLGFRSRTRCAQIRGELIAEVAGLTRRTIPGFTDGVPARLRRALADTDAEITERLADLGLTATLPAASPELPALGGLAPTSRRLENRLMLLLGGGFGFGVALTAGRALTELVPGRAGAAAALCALLGTALTCWVVAGRRLLGQRAALGQWALTAVAALRDAGDQQVAARMLTAETELVRAEQRLSRGEPARIAELDARIRAATGAARREESAAASRLRRIEAALEDPRLRAPAMPRDQSPETPETLATESFL